MRYVSHSPEETYEYARKIGENAAPGTVIALTGDLGAGKTLFTQGLAAGLGITEPVNSPTFTILQIYDTGRLPLYHMDVYRIEDPDEIWETGLDDCLYGSGVTVIEWADMISDLLPEGHLRIQLGRDPAQGDDYRTIDMTGMET